MELEQRKSPEERLLIMRNKQHDSFTSYDGYYKYDHGVSETYDCSREVERHWLLEDIFIGNYLQDRHVDCLLDLPVGTGRFFHHYSGVRNVTGVDISEEMLLKAKEKLTFLPQEVSIHLEQGDVFTLPFSDAVFDAVIVFRLFHLMPATSLGPAIKELCRVCRKEVVAQTYVPMKGIRSHFRLILRAFSRICTSLFKHRNPSTQATSPAKPWSHIQAYYHKQVLIDAKFAACGFLPSASTLLDEYENYEVRATVYSKTI